MMIVRIIALVFSLLIPFGSMAETCSGQNLIDGLSSKDRAELDEAVAAQAYPDGLLWQAKKGDTTLWLFGTLHLFDDEAIQLLGKLRPLIQLSDAVYVEGTREDMELLQSEMLRNAEFMFNYDNPTLPDVLSEQEWQILSAAISERGIPAFLASKLAPWLVSVTISLPMCAVRLQQQGMEGLDLHIMDYAQTLDKPLRALEPYDTLFSVFENLTFDDQISMLRAAILNLAIGEDGFATMRQQYLSGNIRQIWELNRMLSYQTPGVDRVEVDRMMAASEASLLEGRNLNWLEKVLPEAEGKSVFVAAGALHLAGNSGLLNLLDQRGFELTRLDGAVESSKD